MEEGAAEDWTSWEVPLGRFAAATGLLVTAVDGEGRRRLGPFASTRLGSMLAGSALFAEGGEAIAIERQLASDVARGDDAATSFLGLRVHALPLPLGGGAAGAVVFGWVLADFASGVGCERIARVAGLPGRPLWHVARLEAPVSEQRMATLTALLSTLLDSGVQLRDAVAHLTMLGRTRELFLAHVSHELRTPLSSMAMRLEILLRGDLADPAAVRAALEAMRRNVQEETRLVEDLLEAAVTRTGRFSVAKAPADLAAIAGMACEVVEPMAAQRGVTLTLHTREAPALPILADARRLQQALWNVISNAVKFAPDGGRVDVRTVADDGIAGVEVSDDGPGIPPTLLPHIFEAFSRRTTTNAKGLGLGLTITRQIVELHGGRIAVESTPGRPGTTFRLSFPRATGEP